MSIEDFLPFFAKGFWKFLVSKSLTSLFCMSHVHAHNSQLRMQTCFAVDFLSNFLHFTKFSICMCNFQKKKRGAGSVTVRRPVPVPFPVL